MGRGRISMELIQKEKSRKSTFQKRKDGLMKKVNEFSILCDVDVCVVLYAPNFVGRGFAEPETWPKDKRAVERILQKYYNTTSDRRPKIYDVQEYFKERIRKLEFEITKVRKEKLKMMYPTWNESFNSLGAEQLILFASKLEAKLDACNQKKHMLKEDLKGKTIAHESHKVDKLISTPSLTPNPSYYFNLMQNSMSQAQTYPPMMNISDKNPLGFWPLQSGQSSQPSSLISNIQSSHRVESEEGRYVQSYPYKHIDVNGANWSNQVNANVTYNGGYQDRCFGLPKINMERKDGAEKDYNGNAMTMQSYPITMHTLPFQNLSNLPHGFQLNGFNAKDILQAHMFMNGRK
ncbi:putative transcription factor MADS-type1 family [Medicago truncatula]|uniref:MADS-box transcription factor family protein n=1 Tax=Medicago truncatula TaxID=3880 RepID=A0A072VR19_MEDTR|nr:MADS-box transcription factor family protein [Medicago truncatula]RHN82658.1 putative transcription factor MADS-type1 family [Medicago truncatula]